MESPNQVIYDLWQELIFYITIIENMIPFSFFKSSFIHDDFLFHIHRHSIQLIYFGNFITNYYCGNCFLVMQKQGYCLNQKKIYYGKEIVIALWRRT